MKTLGFAILGLFAGVLVGLVLTNVIARLVVGDGGGDDMSMPVTLLLGFLAPVCGIAGAVVGGLAGQRVGR